MKNKKILAVLTVLLIFASLTTVAFAGTSANWNWAAYPQTSGSSGSGYYVRLV